MAHVNIKHALSRGVEKSEGPSVHQPITTYSCKIEYGSCSLFQEYEQVGYQLNKILLRSSKEEPIMPPQVSDDDTDDGAIDMLVKGCIVAIGSLWFTKFQQISSSKDEVTDD